jgi:hypothetical protein
MPNKKQPRCDFKWRTLSRCRVTKTRHKCRCLAKPESHDLLHTCKCGRSFKSEDVPYANAIVRLGHSGQG